MDKEEVRRDVELRVGRMDVDELPASARCLYYAMATVESIRSFGFRAILQAGTCMWPMIRPEDDDGKRSTHFSYVWSPLEPASVAAMKNNLMPEMHVWAALLEMDEIVDFTTRFWPAQAKLLAGFDWPGDQPPDYLWCQADQLPKDVFYRPVMEATSIALALISRKFGKDRAVALVS